MSPYFQILAEVFAICLTTSITALMCHASSLTNCDPSISETCFEIRPWSPAICPTRSDPILRDDDVAWMQLRFSESGGEVNTTSTLYSWVLAAFQSPRVSCRFLLKVLVRCIVVLANPGKLRKEASFAGHHPTTRVPKHGDIFSADGHRRYLIVFTCCISGRSPT